MNGLSGKIPKEIFSFPNLGTLTNFSSNSLTGNLPPEIQSLEMEQGLDFSKNKLSGSIPPTIGECSNLFYRDLSTNSFQGHIPTSLPNIEGLEYIDLSSKNLSGSIPSLGNLQYLQLLNLSENKLQDLGLPKCTITRSHSGRSQVLLIAISAATIVALTVFVFLVMSFLKRKRTRRQSSTETEEILDDGLTDCILWVDVQLVSMVEIGVLCASETAEERPEIRQNDDSKHFEAFEGNLGRVSGNLGRISGYSQVDGTSRSSAAPATCPNKVVSVHRRELF
ncbi:hypothetical protein RJ639_032186 [Escallonia herrerae]|uniref:Uncharacterized protein n=1 Tax=Escallonia herrerae TaxID=1293975 RepID=A0AA88WU94_9ASTE|nr:hypothetical protein RJ639_032186 [Escallonia herrerae]